MVLSLVDAGASHRFARELERKGPTVFPGVPPGRYTAALGIEHQWAVLSVKAKGASQTGGVVEFPETGKVELAVMADPNAAEVEGRVLRAGKPQPGVIVILRPKPRGTTSPHTASTRPTATAVLHGQAWPRAIT